jgi:predicted transcriptional regulator of viral defense system
MISFDASILAAASRLVVFRTSDIVSAVGADQSPTSRALARLQRAHLLTRLVRGVWADTKHPLFSPYIVAPLITETNMENSECYVSFLSALSLHGMISQIPGAIHLATTAQRRPVKTPIGEYHFHQLDRALFDGFEAGDKYGRFSLATPTKALFDTLYVSARRSRQFAHLPELELPRSVTDKDMRRWISRISSSTLRAAVDARWQSIRSTKQRAVSDDEGAVERVERRLPTQTAPRR